MKTKKFVLIFFILYLTTVTYPQIIHKVTHPFSGKVVLSFAGGTTLPLTDYSNPRLNLLGEAGLGYFFNFDSRHTLGLTINAGYGKIHGKDGVIIPNDFYSTIASLSGGITYSYFMSQHFTPYLYAGIGNLWYNPKDDKGIKLPNTIINPGDLTQTTYNFRAGIDYFIARNLSMNLNAGFIFGKNDLIDGYIKNGSRRDAIASVSLGFTFAFSGWKGGSGGDADGDGVPDDEDKCPGTPPGTKVTVDGCPIDADGDGVPDLQDKCPNTKKGVLVDANGCPEDTDGDGVPDFRDQCPDTPSEVTVNMFGCPIDRDGDGVPDYKDKCAGTPEGIAVNADGCPEGFKPADLKPKLPKPKYNKPKTYVPRTVNPTISANYNINRERSVRGSYGRIWTDGNIYVIQLSSWRNKAKADAVARRLRDQGHNAYVQKAYISKFGRNYYRVRIGYFNSLSEAQRYARKVR